jgi:hypothetical protein
MAAGSKLSIVTTMPAHPAQSKGCKAHPLLVPVNGGIKLKLDKAGINSIQLTGIKLKLPVSAGIVAGISNVIPTALQIKAITKPAMGPLAPTSNNASLLGGNDFCIITAPKVPSGGGPGIKYGEVAFIFFFWLLTCDPFREFQALTRLLRRRLPR